MSMQYALIIFEHKTVMEIMSFCCEILGVELPQPTKEDLSNKDMFLPDCSSDHLHVGILWWQVQKLMEMEWTSTEHMNPLPTLEFLVIVHEMFNATLLNKFFRFTSENIKHCCVWFSLRLSWFDKCSAAASKRSRVNTFIPDVPTLRNLKYTISGFINCAEYLLKRGHESIPSNQGSQSCLESTFGAKKEDDATTVQKYTAHNSRFQQADVTISYVNGLRNNKMYDSTHDVIAQARKGNCAVCVVPAKRTNPSETVSKWKDSMLLFQHVFLKARQQRPTRQQSGFREQILAEDIHEICEEYEDIIFDRKALKRGELAELVFPEFKRRNFRTNTMLMLLLKNKQFNEFLILCHGSQLASWWNTFSKGGEFVANFDFILISLFEKCFELMDEWSTQRCTAKNTIDAVKFFDDWQDSANIGTLFCENMPEYLQGDRYLYAILFQSVKAIFHEFVNSLLPAPAKVSTSLKRDNLLYMTHLFGGWAVKKMQGVVKSAAVRVAGSKTRQHYEQIQVALRTMRLLKHDLEGQGILMNDATFCPTDYHQLNKGGLVYIVRDFHSFVNRILLQTYNTMDIEHNGDSCVEIAWDKVENDGQLPDLFDSGWRKVFTASTFPELRGNAKIKEYVYSHLLSSIFHARAAELVKRYQQDRLSRFNSASAKLGLRALLKAKSRESRAGYAAKETEQQNGKRQKLQVNTTVNEARPVVDKDTHIYCICRKRDDGSRMIYCDGCDDWFHPKCLELASVAIDEMEGKKFYCRFCLKFEEFGQTFNDAEFLRGASDGSSGSASNSIATSIQRYGVDETVFLDAGEVELGAEPENTTFAVISTQENEEQPKSAKRKRAQTTFFGMVR
ncbi:hypothetical protein BCR33DRAFT_448187 [Rhizoclosmatium globosum]|uniref:PHD-type domain-containing protein n=1 Tax=Rhizoclosmatium globosum TaxID=329046 RepID=A0A1Y2BS94_9FUNG|nr:hypothetical protein BCR33DRAFT_448187 [Rhizoclosmatium globosum]|eukprot:ORY37621.1 hypothetical protein BCR33DRAFT_448187 [Rhizoclosmatium globosum]